MSRSADCSNIGCTTNGIMTYTCACGDSYTRRIGFSGHSYTGVVTEPTCTEGGYTTYTCDRCCKSYLDCLTEPTGHSCVDDCCVDCGVAVLPVKKEKNQN